MGFPALSPLREWLSLVHYFVPSVITPYII